MTGNKNTVELIRNYIIDMGLSVHSIWMFEGSASTKSNNDYDNSFEVLVNVDENLSSNHKSQLFKGISTCLAKNLAIIPTKIKINGN